MKKLLLLSILLIANFANAEDFYNQTILINSYDNENKTFDTDLGTLHLESDHLRAENSDRYYDTKFNWAETQQTSSIGNFYRNAVKGSGGNEPSTTGGQQEFNEYADDHTGETTEKFNESINYDYANFFIGYDSKTGKIEFYPMAIVKPIIYTILKVVSSAIGIWLIIIGIKYIRRFIASKNSKGSKSASGVSQGELKVARQKARERIAKRS